MTVLPDVLAPGLDVVFCGTAVGSASRRLGAYYAGPGNRFWEMLGATGLTPRELLPEQFEQLPEYGIGLTDLAKTAYGADTVLSGTDFDVAGLLEKLDRFKPKILAFNGKRAAQECLQRKIDYGFVTELFADSKVTVLPSTSGAARGYWDPTHWFDLASEIGRDRVVNAP